MKKGISWEEIKGNLKRRQKWWKVYFLFRSLKNVNRTTKKQKQKQIKDKLTKKNQNEEKKKKKTSRKSN